MILGGDEATNKDVLQRAGGSIGCNQILSLQKSNGSLVVLVVRGLRLLRSQTVARLVKRASHIIFLCTL